MVRDPAPGRFVERAELERNIPLLIASESEALQVLGSKGPTDLLKSEWIVFHRRDLERRHAD